MLGTTSEECEFNLDMPHQTVSARRTDLQRLGLIDYARDERGKRERRPTTSGRFAYVKVATTKGKDTIKFGWRISAKGDPTRGRHKGNPMSNEAFESLKDTSVSARRVLAFMVKRS
jgi:hypothetical protein